MLNLRAACEIRLGGMLDILQYRDRILQLAVAEGDSGGSHFKSLGVVTQSYSTNTLYVKNSNVE